MNHGEASNPPINNHFMTMLQGHRQGMSITDLSEAMAKASEAALLTNRPAKLTLTLTFKPAGKTPGALVIEDDIATKLPKAEKVNSIFYYQDGALVRNDPNQTQLDLKPVEKQVGDQLEELRKQQQAGQAATLVAQAATVN